MERNLEAGLDRFIERGDQLQALAPFDAVDLVAAPAHAYGAKNELSKAARLQRLARLDDRNVETVLFDDEQL